MITYCASCGELLERPLETDAPEGQDVPENVYRCPNNHWWQLFGGMEPGLKLALSLELIDTPEGW